MILGFDFLFIFKTWLDVKINKETGGKKLIKWKGEQNLTFSVCPSTK